MQKRTRKLQTTASNCNQIATWAQPWLLLIYLHMHSYDEVRRILLYMHSYAQRASCVTTEGQCGRSEGCCSRLFFFTYMMLFWDRRRRNEDDKKTTSRKGHAATVTPTTPLQVQLANGQANRASKRAGKNGLFSDLSLSRTLG